MLIAFQACKKDVVELVPFSELGAQTNEFIVPNTAGEVKVKVLSNSEFTVDISPEDTWLKTDGRSFRGDTTITFTFTSPAVLGTINSLVCAPNSEKGTSSTTSFLQAWNAISISTKGTICFKILTFHSYSDLIEYN
ncbi:BACON domain-containing protein [Sphingobacterium sp. T2]|uniref:BACON domain-containing protein n=1 Tax=Sphingobacterium sp. T2 TaxID=1590596 RepID=UPI00057B88CB|nr:BACON domain-containing protein [Sphingobacterium sp. T2]